MTKKNNENGNGHEDTPKPGILDRLNLDPFAPSELEKSTEEEKREKREDPYKGHRGERGKFLPGMPGGPGRPKGLYSLRKMIQSKGDVVVEQDEKKRTYAQLLVDRLWMNAVAGSERAINMVIESVDGPMLPPEPPEKPIKVYKVDFHGTTIINRRDEKAEDELMSQPEVDFIDVPAAESEAE